MIQIAGTKRLIYSSACRLQQLQKKAPTNVSVFASLSELHRFCIQHNRKFCSEPTDFPPTDTNKSRMIFWALLSYSRRFCLRPIADTLQMQLDESKNLVG